MIADLHKLFLLQETDILIRSHEQELTKIPESLSQVREQRALAKVKMEEVRKSLEEERGEQRRAESALNDAETLLADFDKGVNAALKRKGVKI